MPPEAPTAPNVAPPAAAPAAPAEPTFEEMAATLFKTEPADAAGSTSQGEPDAIPTAPGSSTEKPDERVSPRLIAAHKAELRASQARTELRQTQAQLEARQKDIEDREARVKLLEDDPVKAFEILKIDPKAFLDKLAGEQKPDNIAAKELAEVKAKLARLEENEQQGKTEATKREQAAASEKAWSEASSAFCEHIGANVEKYPHLVAEYTEAQAVEAAYAALTEPVARDAKGKVLTRYEAYVKEFGYEPTDDVIAAFIDDRAKALAETKAKSAWRKSNGDSAGTAPGQGKSPGDLNPAAQTVRGSSPRTLTSRDASSRATGQKPWSQEAADEESLRIIEAGLRKS